jgi:hypothetical protein
MPFVWRIQLACRCFWVSGFNPVYHGAVGSAGKLR